ncbi:MAG: PilZ domain-containing protein, partial [Pyrinomonadaceae bacterium]|nr:PilZ domain-containing protein [Phycisphaerales bacterium]
MSDAHPVVTNRWESYSDPLKLDQPQFDSLVQGRVKGSSPPDAGARRTWKRLRIAGRLWAPAEMQGPSGFLVQTRVYPIDISVGGMAFYTGMFVHNGTMFSLTLQMSDGIAVVVKGTCVRCGFVKGRVHEVGLQFTENFDMTLVMPAGAAAHLSDPSEPGGVRPPSSPADSELGDDQHAKKADGAGAVEPGPNHAAT